MPAAGDFFAPEAAWLTLCCIATSVLHAFWFKRGPRPPIGFAKGGPKFFKEGPFFVVEILTSFEEFGGQFCVYC